MTAYMRGLPFTCGWCHLDGSGSTDPDPGDSVAMYTFNFGDGTPDVVDSTSATVSHTYDSTHKCPGSGDVRTCTATLTVKDQSGAQSANVATVAITVTYTSVRTNYALGLNGGLAVATSSHSSGSYPASSAINGDRKGNTWGQGTGGWNDGTRGAYPDTLEVDLMGSRVIDEINVITLQNNWTTAGEPDLSTPATGEGILDFTVQYFDPETMQWVAIPGCPAMGNCVTGNNNAWRQFTFAPNTTTKIRVVVNNSRNNWSRIVELEAVGAGGQ